MFLKLKCWDTELGERYTHDIIPNRTVCIEQGMKDDNRTQWKGPDSGITFDNVWIAYIALFQVHTKYIFFCKILISMVKRNYKMSQQHNIIQSLKNYR